MTTEIQKSETVIADLERKRELCVRRGVELADERSALAYSAHTSGDAKAAKRLAEIHAAIATHASELESFDAALKAAGERLRQAQAAESRAQDKVNAEALHRVVADIGARIRKADKHFAAAIDELNAVHVDLDKVHALGSSFPTHSQFAVNAIMALKTWLRELPESPF